MPPLKASDVVSAKRFEIPEQVFEAFNRLIAKGWNGQESIVTQSEVVEEIKTAMGITSGDAFDRRWLNVEPCYERSGWDVEYDKPGYNESYSATFRFTKKATRG